MSLFELGSEISKFIFPILGEKARVFCTYFTNQTNPWNFSYPNPNLNGRGPWYYKLGDDCGHSRGRKERPSKIFGGWE